MKFSRPALNLAFLCLAVSSLSAHAGRPLQTEDAGVLEARTCEIEGATARERVPGVATGRETSLQVGCGAGFESQFSLAVSRASSGGASDSGWRIGGKTGLWKGQGDDAPAFTLAWGVTGVKAAGSGWETGTVQALGVFSAPLAGMTMHLNLGHVRDVAAGQTSTPWGVALEHPGFGAWAPMAEIFGDDRGAPWWNLGLRWTLAKDQAYVDVSWGRQMAPGRPTLATAGFKFVF